MAKYKRWTITELQFIKENVESMSDNDLAAQLSKITGSVITTAMIRRQRRKLSIAKTRGRRKVHNILIEQNKE